MLSAYTSINKLIALSDHLMVFFENENHIPSDAAVQTSVIQQQKRATKDSVTKDIPSYSLKRSLMIGIGYGSLWFAPILHVVTTTWARILPSTSLPALGFKALIDMTTSFPINISFMMGLQSYVRDPEADIIDSVRRNFWPSYTAGLILWPGATMLNYGIVPLRFRVLFLNTLSLGWNFYLVSRFQ